VTWHNAWHNETADQPIIIDWRNEAVQGALGLWVREPNLVRPSSQVVHDELAMTAYTLVVAKPDQDVVVRFQPLSSEHRVVLNAFAWDITDPSYQTRVHWPQEADEHVPPHPRLTWQPPRVARESRAAEDLPAENSTLSAVPTVGLDGNQKQPAILYHIYFDTSRQRVNDATRSSPAYLGSTPNLSWQVSADDCLLDYFWRVDSEWNDGRVTPGPVRRFRVRELAFAGAEGYGRFAMGGRGGRVIEVTSLEDAGPGTLREAIEAVGARTIVFRVGGTIRLKSKLLIRNPYVTIAGQTAPGDGICVRGYTFGCFGTHDVVMRHIRLRVGDESGETMDGTGFASTDHAIFDHCSISWSIDEAVSSRSAKNITLQRCIVAEALNVANHRKYEAGKGHSFAGSISGDIGSFHHNLLAHCAGRNWSLAGGLDRRGLYAGRLDIRNNVVFNWEYRTNDGGVKALNLVANLYIPGPATRVFHLLKPDAGSPADRQQYYVAGNRMEGRFHERGDNWSDAVMVDDNELAEIRLDSPHCSAHVTMHSMDELLENVLSDVGANFAGLDAVDQRIIEDVRQRSVTFYGSRTGLPGIIDSQQDAGGWPELRGGHPPIDTDHDGLPDTWEVTHNLDPHQPDQNTRLAGGTPTALEDYLIELCRVPSQN
jgi:hypothetical protein